MQIGENQKILGIDYGRAKIGIAFGKNGLAEPFKVVRYKDIRTLVTEIGQIVRREDVDKIVVGISEGAMAGESKEFAETMGRLLKIKVDLFDETLSSRDAQTLSIEAGVSRKRRQKMEDAYAASIMLQNYLDEKT